MYSKLLLVCDFLQKISAVISNIERFSFESEFVFYVYFLEEGEKWQIIKHKEKKFYL